MYKVNVTTRGKYDNVEPGERYFLFKKDFKEFYNALLELECDFEASKFLRLYRGGYAWSIDAAILDT